MREISLQFRLYCPQVGLKCTGSWWSDFCWSTRLFSCQYESHSFKKGHSSWLSLNLWLTSYFYLILWWHSSSLLKKKMTRLKPIWTSLRESTSKAGSLSISLLGKFGFISSVPFQIIELIGSDDTGGTYAKLIRLARLPRLYRLFRILRVCKGIQKAFGRKCAERMRAMRANSGMSRMCSVLVYVMIALHIISCLWVMTSKIDNLN